MNIQTHEELKGKIWEIANRLRGPYRPPQYRLVMLPMVVLRRLDCVLEPTKDAVLKRRDELEAQQMPEAAMDRLNTRRYFPLRLPVALDARRAVFVYLDPGHETATALRSWGAAHRELWKALWDRGCGIEVVAIVRTPEEDSRAETVLAN